MSATPSPALAENYFRYFTEVEECFRRCRGTPTLLSTLDWALVESWMEAGIPLAAVITGIERTFEKYDRRPRPFRRVNGLGYCTQMVLEAAEQMKASQVEDGRRPSPGQAPAPFTAEQLQTYFRRNAQALRAARKHCQTRSEQVLAEDFEESAATLDRLAAGINEAPGNLQDLELELATLEEKLEASLRRGCPTERLVELRRQVERGVARFRGQMTADQLQSLDRQFLKKSLFERYEIPRLSLFYCSP